jgi:CubicO group peptidase (beta-lactamase class C family)
MTAQSRLDPIVQASKRLQLCAIVGCAVAAGTSVRPVRRMIGFIVIRVVVWLVVAAALAVTGVGCGSSSPQHGSRYVRYHDPSDGWTAVVPAGWTWVALEPGWFVRGNPVTDPSGLLLRTYRNRSPAAARHALAVSDRIAATAPAGERVGHRLRWQLYRGRQRQLVVELAVAREGADAHVAALIARRAELGRMVRTVLLPALDSFVPGSPDPPVSVLARTPRDPSYWPTTGWRTASPASQGMDGKRLDAMVAEIRAAKLPIDSVTVVRHGNVVLDRSFGPFSRGTLPELATGPLHDLRSVTKSVTSMLLGIAMHERAASGVGANTPLVRVAAAIGYRPKRLDARKRAMTLEDLLTMQSGLAWKEWGYAYEPGSGNDAMAMAQTRDWSAYAIDRPMATRPGTTFVYNTGAAHLVSGVVSILTRHPAAELARRRLFAPLGIRDFQWMSDPSGVTAGECCLRLQPRDLAKLAFLYLHQGRWDGRQIVPAGWVIQSTTDHVADPRYEYGYFWWLDRADGYAYMSGLYGQLAAVIPGKDLVAVITAHLPENLDASLVPGWLLEKYILPAAD